MTADRKENGEKAGFPSPERKGSAAVVAWPNPSLGVGDVRFLLFGANGGLPLHFDHLQSAPIEMERFFFAAGQLQHVPDGHAVLKLPAHVADDPDGVIRTQLLPPA